MQVNNDIPINSGNTPINPPPLFQNKYKALFLKVIAELVEVVSISNAQKIKGLAGRVEYGNAFIGPARNIATNEVIRNQRDKIACKRLINLSSILTPEQKLRVSAFEGLNVETDIRDGICSGIRLDIASSYLNGGSIEEIVQKNSSGGSADAAANQAVYVALKSSTPRKEIINTVNQTLIGHNLRIKNDLYLMLNLKSNLFPFPRNSSLHPMLSQALSKDTLPSWLKESEGKIFISDYQAFKSEVLKNFPNYESDIDLLISLIQLEDLKIVPPKVSIKPPIWQEIVNKLKQIFGSRPHDIDLSCITNPIHRQLFHRIIVEQGDNQIYETVSYLRGVKLGPFLNNCFKDTDNEPSYQKLLEVRPGFYALSFYLDGGGHAISFIKETNGTCYILDPNGDQLRANNAEDAVKLLRHVIDGYPKPGKSQFPWAGKDFNQILISEMTLTS